MMLVPTSPATTWSTVWTSTSLRATSAWEEHLLSGDNSISGARPASSRSDIHPRHVLSGGKTVLTWVFTLGPILGPIGALALGWLASSPGIELATAIFLFTAAGLGLGNGAV